MSITLVPKDKYYGISRIEEDLNRVYELIIRLTRFLKNAKRNWLL